MIADIPVDRLLLHFLLLAIESDAAVFGVEWFGSCVAAAIYGCL